MNLKNIFLIALSLVLFGFASNALAQNNTLAARNEAAVVSVLRTIHGAQATYQSTSGNGNFASLAQLGEVNLLPLSLTDGSYRGYIFVVVTRDRSNCESANFEVIAVPQLYKVTGVRSFHIGLDGVIRGANKKGAPANQNDPSIIEEDSCVSEADCEAKAIASLRTIHGAQATYQSAEGNGKFASSLAQLGEAQLIDKYLAAGRKRGYVFFLSKSEPSNTTSVGFEVTAVPQQYPLTGRRSSYINWDGVVRGADKNGAPATIDDPAIVNQ